MKNYIHLIISILIVFSCAEKEEKSVKKEADQPQDLIIASKEAQHLIKNQCYLCHSPVSSSHDLIIAPPMAAVKMRYSRIYPNKDAFVDAIVSYAMNPDKEAALMQGAVDRYGIMPKQAFQRADMIKIALYIYENELEEPAWFAAHEKEMHGKGIGRNKLSKK